MEEEFDESDVVFCENGGILVRDDVASGSDSCPDKPKRKKKRRKKTEPMDIPENKESSVVKCVESDFLDEEAKFVPPHLIVGRRVYARKMAFSVCYGKGRTLKGRDLCQFRNSILRMTGFLET